MPSWRKVITSGSDANLKSLVVSQSVSAESFTGSLYGTASYSEYFVSYSYVTQSVEVTSSTYSQTSSISNFAETASYSLNAQQYTEYIIIETSSWIINHGLNTLTPIVSLYNGENEIIQADRVKATSPNTLQVDFTVPVSGTLKILNIY